MLTKKQFVNQCNYYRTIDNFLNKLEDEYKISLYDTPIFSNSGLMFDNFIYSHFEDEDTQDLIFTRLYEQEASPEEVWDEICN